MILDTLSNIERYAALHPCFPQAIRFLQRPDLVASPDGRHELLDGNHLYASLSSYETQPFEGGLLEGHQNYIDIQFTLAGRESMGWAPFQGQPVATPYDPPRDIAFFHGPCQRITLQAGDFMILWPSDLHLPMRHFANTAEHVRKVVVKVKVEAK